MQEGAPVRTPRASIMRTPRDGAAVPSDGVPSSPAAPQQRRERTKSVVWKDAPPPKGTPKGAEKPELSTVVTYAREPGTNARKVVRPFDRAVAHHSFALGTLPETDRDRDRDRTEKRFPSLRARQHLIARR